MLRDDPDSLRAAQEKRGLSGDVVDRALEADITRRTAIADFERLRGEQKQLGKLIPQAQGEENRGAELVEHVCKLLFVFQTVTCSETARKP